MPKVYVLVGVPGSGKSTWIWNQHWIVGMEYVSTDYFVEKFARRMGKTYSEVFEQVMPRCVRLMARAVRRARANGSDIVWDQTSTTVKSRERKFRMLPDYWHIAVVFPTPEVSVLKERLAGRPGKEVPWEVVQGMIDNFEMPSEEEGYKEIWRA
jgi:predicted kinase